MIKRYSLFLFSILLLTTFSFAEEKKEFDLSVPLEQARIAEQEGDYDKAIENYRKILFFAGGDAKVQFQVAETLQKKGNHGKALSEYKMFLKIVKDDKRLTDVEKNEMIRKAEAAIVASKKSTSRWDLLTFTDWNVFIITLLLGLTFLYQIISWWLSKQEVSDKDDKKLEGIFREPYWKEKKEKEIESFTLNWFSLIMFFLLVIFIFLSVRIVLNLS